MLKQMIRQKLQQTLKQPKGEVFPLPLPVTAPSCTVFCNPTPSSLFHPFPRSKLCLGKARGCQPSKERVLRNPPRTQSSPAPLARMMWFGLWQTELAPGTRGWLESWFPPAGRALQRILHAHPPSTGWTVDWCVEKLIPGRMNRGLNEWEMSSLLQKSPPSHLNRKLTLKPLCSPWHDFVHTQLWNMVAICCRCTGLRKYWGG